MGGGGPCGAPAGGHPPPNAPSPPLSPTEGEMIESPSGAGGCGSGGVEADDAPFLRRRPSRDVMPKARRPFVGRVTFGAVAEPALMPSISLKAVERQGVCHALHK